MARGVQQLWFVVLAALAVLAGQAFAQDGPATTPEPQPVPTASPEPAPEPAAAEPTTTATQAAEARPKAPIPIQPVRKRAPARISLIRKGQQPASTPAPQPAATSVPEATPVPEPTPQPAVARAEPTPRPARAAEPAAEAPAAKPAEPTAEPEVQAATASAATAAAPPASQPEPAAPENDVRAQSGYITAQFAAALLAPPGADARSQLRALIISYPEAVQTPRALLRIGEISEQLNDPEEALRAFAAAAASNLATTETLHARREVGRLAYQTGRFEQAATALAELRALFPELRNEPEPATRQALALAARGQYLEAQPLWAIAQAAGNPDAAEQAGAPAAIAADTATTATAATPTATQSPAAENAAAGNAVRAAAMLGEGLSLELQGQLGAAREAFERLVRDLPTSPEAELARRRLADLTQPLIP